MPITTTVLVLVGGSGFAAGFVTGQAVFSLLLRRRERRLAVKIKAVEAARLALHRQGVELDAWVVDAIDREQQAAKQRRRSWWRRLWRWSK